MKVYLRSTTQRKKGMHENSQKGTFGNAITVYGRVFHVRERLHIDESCGRTTCGKRQSSSGRRSGSQPANRTSPGVCEARELLGERENHTRRSHDYYRKTHILRPCTAGISNPEEFGEEREENQKDGLTVS